MNPYLAREQIWCFFHNLKGHFYNFVCVVRRVLYSLVMELWLLELKM